ncbi:recombinase family protein [Roseburia hominis]|uniref:recombinase family protein n=1 Tax=Roseburia hominis TaxID=301301 RepID=UPI001F26B9E6|nr:recombinase family protein [Roseburia hominis]
MADIVAMYIRISLEDDDLQNGKAESNSITNQRELISTFILGKDEFSGCRIKEFFDDGFTGRNFDRPGFQGMITECRAGNIKCIVVKDLSRLGRNYVEVGNLLEQLFPFLGVRVISINDNYDSDAFNGQTGGIDVAFKNLVYNLYSRDLSQKVKSAVTTRMKRGEYIGPFGLFGYKKSPTDIHKLVVDDDAAAIVRRIFLMVIDNMPRREIVKILNEENVPTPAVYKQRKGCTRDWFPDGKKGGWNTSMIAKIIRDERYAGHMVSHKKEYESFDSKHQIAVDKSDWIIIRNTHEAIVTQEEFDRANANMRYVSRGKKDNPANKKNFSVIICPHCGLTLRLGNKKDIYMYCPTGRNHNDSPCQNVRIRKDVVESTLVKLVRNQAEMLVTAEKILKQKKEKCSGQNQPEVIIKRLQAEMKKLESSKIADYESYKAGKMEREAFTEKKALIDTRKQEILSAIDEMEAKLLIEDEEQRQYQDAFEIKKYIHLEKYDKAVMAALILKAEVVDENRLNVVWKHQDIYEKIFSIL